jgi:ABC-2 type transport system ATP-binding protein
MISCYQLTKSFGGKAVVNRLSFVAQPGQVLGFLGPNGAGKTTTMKMITGFLLPDSGEIEVCGLNVQQHPLAVKRRIGYLPEGAPGYGEMAVGDFLRFIAQLRGLRGQALRQSLDKVVWLLSLEAVLGQPLETLSKGFRRRVGLAQAVIHDPQVLILDEPTDGLDPNQKHQVRKLIARMAEEKTIVLSTHILEEVNAVCDRVIIIARGQLVAEGTPHQLELYSRYHRAISFEADIPFQLLDELQSLSCVLDVEYDARRKQVTVIPAQGLYIFDEVSDFLRQHDVVVRRLRMEAGRLDEVFMNLTNFRSRDELPAGSAGSSIDKKQGAG